MNKNQALKILGLTRDANPEEIKKAYRKKAMEFHPDRNQNNPEAEDKAKQINLAYECLTKPESEAGGNFSDLEEMFQELYKDHFGFKFSNSSRFNTQPVKNPPFLDIINFGDIQLGNVNLTLQTILFREVINLNIKVKAVCKTCLEDKDSWVACDTCKQSGSHAQVIQNGMFYIQQNSKCSSCGGKGWIRKKHCRGCKDRLFIIKDKSLSFVLPNNFSPGQTVRLNNKGHENWNTADGDVFFQPNIQLPHNISNLNSEENELLKKLLTKCI